MTPLDNVGPLGLFILNGDCVFRNARLMINAERRAAETAPEETPGR